MLTEEQQAILDQAVEDAHQEILNAPPIIEEETTSRFKGAEWYEIVKELSIGIAGLGGIGSWTSLLVAKLNPSCIFLHDFDTVEPSNMSGQLCSIIDYNALKTNSVSSLLAYYADYHNVSLHGEFTNLSRASKIMICGFDNMRARELCFNNWLNKVKKAEDLQNYLFIDGRLNMEEFQILCIKGDDSRSINNYKNNYLFKDNEVPDTVCSMKQTAFCSALIAGFITNLLINFATNLGKPLIDRDLPFYTEYNAKTMFLKTIS